jgi:hypothetical protein
MLFRAEYMNLNDTCLFFCKDMDFLFQSDAGMQTPKKAKTCHRPDSAHEVARLRTDVRFASKIPQALAVASKVKAAVESLDPQGFDDLFGTLSWIFDMLKEEDKGTVSIQIFSRRIF